MIHLMVVPAQLIADVASGAAYVAGALVKDGATHQVLAHLQPTRRLSEGLFSAMVKGPLAPVELLMEAGQSVQLMNIERMLNTVQTVASIGAAASVLNLGVSVGGFALVLSRLKTMQQNLTRLEATAQRIENKMDGDFFSELETALRRAEETFALSGPEQEQRWLEMEGLSDYQMGKLIRRLKGLGVDLEGSKALPPAAWSLLGTSDVSSHLSLLFNLVDARAEALLCLGRPQPAAQLLRRTEGWFSTWPTDPQAVASARVGGRPAAPSQLIQVAQQSKALTAWGASARTVAQERAMILQSLHDLGVDTPAYVLQVRNHPTKDLLMLPHV